MIIFFIYWIDKFFLLYDYNRNMPTKFNYFYTIILLNRYLVWIILKISFEVVSTLRCRRTVLPHLMEGFNLKPKVSDCFFLDLFPFWGIPFIPLWLITPLEQRMFLALLLRTFSALLLRMFSTIPREFRSNPPLKALCVKSMLQSHD